MTLWTAPEAAAATGGLAQGDWSATGVSIDSRTIEAGDLFVALTAARDGHEFVAKALEQGAAAALVSRVPANVARDAPLLIVDDVQTALEDLGRAARARCTARVVAVTGSVGKTSTKEMIAQILSDQGRTHASIASYNNQWGVPLTLARMPRDAEFAVIEIGMNHPGEIAPLARQARPHVALITTVAAAHLEAFRDISEIAAEKAAILEGLEPGGVAILNTDIEEAEILTGKARAVGAKIVGFGYRADDYRLEDARVQGPVTVARARVGDETLLFRINSPGRHFAMNGLGALASCAALGVDPALAVMSLGRWRPYDGRGAHETIRLDPVESDLTLDLFDDAYNANPTSLAAALDVLAAMPVRDGTGRIGRGRRIAFLGDMKELGANEAEMHRTIADLPAISRIDRVHCTGPLMKNLFDALPQDQRGAWSETSAEMARNMRSMLDSGDVVLVKGSLSMQMKRIVDAIRKMGHPAPQQDR